MIRCNKNDENIIISRYLNGEKTTKICKDYGYCYATILNILKRNNIPIKSNSDSHKKYSVNDNYFKNIDSEDKAYFLGLMYADGCIHSTQPRILISLQIDDIEILELFKNKINYSGNLYTHKYYACKEQKCLEITSSILKNDLINKGCFNNKSLTLRFPNEIQVPRYLINHFIRGVFDGDGSIFINKRIIKNIIYDECGFSIVGSINFINGLYDYLIDIGFVNISTYFTNNNKNKYLLIKSKHELYNIYNYLYNNSTIFLNRKKNKFIEVLTLLNNKPNFYNNDKINQYDKNNVFLKTWDNVKQIEDFYNIKRDSIFKCIRGKIKTSYGFIWKCEYKQFKI